MKVKFSRKFQRFAVSCVSIAFHFYFGYHVIGKENIPEGGCVVCPNHSQLSDGPLIAVCLGKHDTVRIMAKKELFSSWWLGPLIRSLGVFPIDRTNVDLTAIKTALQSVRSNNKLVIFPQGTRGAHEGETKRGAAMLAMKARAPILPVYISEDKRFRSHATIVIGKPFYPDAKQKDYGVVADEILHSIYQLKEQL